MGRTWALILQKGDFPLLKISAPKTAARRGELRPQWSSAATLCQRGTEALRSEVISPRFPCTGLQYSLPTYFYLYSLLPFHSLFTKSGVYLQGSMPRTHLPSPDVFLSFPASVVTSPFLEIPMTSFQKPAALSAAMKSAESKLMVIY